MVCSMPNAPANAKSQPDDWSLSWAELQEIFDACEQRGFRCGNFRRFVETGTFLGQTVVALAAHFDELHTIELDNDCYEAAKLASWKAVRPVHFHLGHSALVLEKILPGLAGPAVFYLDAHYSGSVTAGRFLEVPLLEELVVLDRCFSHAGLVVVDDMDLFSKVNSFEVVNGKTGKSSAPYASDWRSITCETICKCFPPDRIQCSFPTPAGSRYILCLKAAAGGKDNESQPRDASGKIIGAVCPDLAWRLADRGATHWLSVPGHPLNQTGIRSLRRQGTWWCRIADAMERERAAKSETCVSCQCESYSKILHTPAHFLIGRRFSKLEKHSTEASQHPRKLIDGV